MKKNRFFKVVYSVFSYRIIPRFAFFYFLIFFLLYKNPKQTTHRNHHYVRRCCLPELLWQLKYCQLMFWKQFFKLVRMTQKAVSQSAYVQGLHFQGRWFSMNKGIQSVRQLPRVVECKFIIKEWPMRTSSKAFGSLPFHTISDYCRCEESIHQKTSSSK